jgi:hypothetical protein
MMNSTLSTLLAGALALSLAACADMDWTKAGADKAAVSRDLDDCRGAALGRSPPANAIMPQDRTVTGAVAPGRPAGSANERFISEHESVRACMVGRGYQLAPAK